MVRGSDDREPVILLVMQGYNCHNSTHLTLEGNWVAGGLGDCQVQESDSSWTRRKNNDWSLVTISV